ncbi:MAG: glycosyltransferase family 2 protein [Isosphaeraceae bacterium]
MTAEFGVTMAIPNWNHELMLPRSLTSAFCAVKHLRSLGIPSEILVIDEASRDGSATLLRQLEAMHYEDGLRVLSFATTASLATSRNEAAHHARYRYVAFLDADNEIVPENLPTFLDVLRDTGAAAAYGNLLVRTASASHAHYMLSNESMQMKLFLTGNYVDAFSVWDRYQILDVGGFDEVTPCLEDFEMWQHLATNGRRIVFVPAVLGYYYILPAAMSSDKSIQEKTALRMRRIFNQTRIRELLPLNTLHLRYHPALGYI